MAEHSVAQTSSTSSLSENFCFGASGLEFLASTASLLTPMQKQPGCQADLDSDQQVQNLSTSLSQNIISVLNTKAPNVVQSISVPTIISTSDNYGRSQRSLQGIQKNISTSHQYIVASQKKEDSIKASVVHLQSLSEPTILETSIPTNTYIVDYNSPSSSSTTLIKSPSSPTVIVAGQSVVLTSSVNNALTTTGQLTPLTSQYQLNRSVPNTSQFLSSNISATSLNSTPSVSSSTTVTGTSKHFMSENQATKNFLKQHTSFIDNNGRILNEEITLGSILRSSNLRNKLLSAASAGKTPISVSASSFAQNVLSCTEQQSSIQSAAPMQTQISVTTILPVIQAEKRLNLQTSTDFALSASYSVPVASIPYQSTPLRIEKGNNDNLLINSSQAPFEVSREYVIVSEGIAMPLSSPSFTSPSTVYSNNNGKF